MGNLTFYLTADLKEGPSCSVTTEKVNQDYIQDNLLGALRIHNQNISENEILFKVSNHKDIATDIAGILLKPNRHELLKSQMSAVIVPLSHGDENTMWHIARELYENHRNELLHYYSEEINDFGRRAKLNGNHDKVPGRGAAAEELIRLIGFNTFESFKFQIGYRFDNTPIKCNSPIEQYHFLVQRAYEDWVGKNLGDWTEILNTPTVHK
jgi:hypothetical protein